MVETSLSKTCPARYENVMMEMPIKLPASLGLEQVRRRQQPMAADAPVQLQVVIDTEEEFDWRKPFSRESVSVSHLNELSLITGIFERHRIVPCYVLDYPIVKSANGAACFRELAAAGQAEIGAHLQPWVNPPHDEQVSSFNSFPANLPAPLERAKLLALTEQIETATGVRARVYKAGRYGVGRQSFETLASLGYRIDLSVMPGYEWVSQGGPDYRHASNDLSWIITESGVDLLEIPTTGGFVGLLAGWGPGMVQATDSTRGESFHLKAMLDSAGLMTRVRLSPEGFGLRHLQRLSDALVARGVRVLTLNFHSPSIAVGHTPYTRTKAERDQFLAVIDDYLHWFAERYGSSFTSPSQLYRSLKGA